MLLRDAIETLFGIGATVETDIMTGKRQMPVGGFGPTNLPALHRLLVAGPDLVDDLTVRPIRRNDAERLAVRAKHRHLFLPESFLRQRPQRRHQVDMRIAVLVVIDPVRDHSFRGQIVPDELPNQRNIFRP